MEAIRMAGYLGTYREVAVSDVVKEDNGKSITVRQGDRVFVSFVRSHLPFQSNLRLTCPSTHDAHQLTHNYQRSSARDASIFPEPEKINPKRPLESYVHYGLGPHACLGPEVSQVALTEMFRAVFGKKNLRRAPGLQGELRKIPRGDGLPSYLTEDWSSISPVPTSMRVCWDED